MPTTGEIAFAAARPGRKRESTALATMLSLVLLASAFAQACAGQDLAEVAPGIEYVHERIGDIPWSIHVVKIRRSDERFRFVSSLAQGRVYGLARVREQIESLPPQWGRPVAAVNGDFFTIRPGPYQGDPTGLHITGAELVSSPIGTSFWVDSAARPHIAEVIPKLKVTWPDGEETPFALNQQRPDDAAVLYTPRVGASTRTLSGIELVLERYADGPWLPLRAHSFCPARVADVHQHGDSPIGPNDMILSIGPQLAEKLPPPAKGAVISFSLETLPSLKDAPVAIGGGPILVSAAKARTWDQIRGRPRHPRTAIGWDEKYYFLVVVDGRQEGLSAGMNYPELAALMLRLGCTDAMNLDGGGSSTLWLGGRVMNSPSDGQERHVANALIVVDRN